MKTRCRTILRQACILLFVLRGLSFAEPIALKRVVELALTHATGGAIAAAEEQRIAAAYHDLRNNYIPQVMTGAGLGWSYGFPLGLEGSADVWREHLAKLPGLAAAAIQTEPESIPAPPALPKENPDNTAASNPSVQAALEHARAQYLRAKGEHRALWPSLDFAAQYALLSKFNNFQNYYIPSHPCVTPLGEFLCVSNSFQQHNATVAVSIRFPLFNASQRSKAQLAEADARKASKQAEAAKNQLSEETLRLQRSVAQLQAARDVAQLEYEIADKNMAAVHTRMDQATATLHDLDDAR